MTKQLKEGLMNYKKYFLDLDFDLEEKKYDGKVKIFLDLKKKINKLDLDSVDLDIKRVKVNDKEIRFEIEKGKLIIKGNFLFSNLIEIDFEGKLIEKLGGIYLSKYKEANQDKYIITTQFEPIDARTAFPCYDHPNFKSVFQVKLAFPKELIAVSNTLPLKEETNNSKKTVIFKETPRMSTYLLYFGIGDFEFLSGKYKNILIRIVTTKGKKEGGKFALDVTKKFLNYFENFFGYHYPLEKLDLIAIPDFASGAMENWGAITFRENLLLHFEGISPSATKLVKAEVIAHELSHMWFGNLVTMKWWDDLWLNESFATYLAYKAVDKYFPKWEIMKDYLLDETISGMSRDVLNSTHPIKVKIRDPNESQEIFDEISYDKGGSVLRTLNLYLGEKDFKNGLKNYIRKFKYGNAKAEDLWLAIQEKSKAPVIKIMTDFITKPGTPIVYLKEKNNKYYLEQKRFTLHEDKNTIWSLPLFLKVNNRSQKFLLNKRIVKLETENIESGFILNENFSGYYLGFLPQEIFFKNIKNYNEKELINLIFTYRLLTKRGDLNLNDFYNVIKETLKEKKTKEIKHLLSLIFDYFIFDFVYLDYKPAKELLYHISNKILEELGFEFKDNDLPIISSLRRVAFFSLNYFFDEEKIKKILDKEIKKIEFEKPEKINPELKPIVLIYGVNKDEKTLSKIVEFYEKTNLIEEKARILNALAKLKNESNLNYYFDYLLTDKVRFNQIVYFFRGLVNNKISHHLTMRWLDKNWEKLEKKGGGRGKSESILIYILKAVIPQFGCLLSEDELKSFLNKYKLKQRFKMTIPYLLELSSINRKFIEMNKK